jgi:glycosyltransferase involved in cell wall biosynthesis
MRIGVDATALFGRFGGVEYALWNLLLALREAEERGLLAPCSWTVWVPRDGPLREARRAFPPSWRWERLPFAGADKARRIAWQQGALPGAARRARLDVLHCPTYVCPLRAEVPVVLGVYDFIALSQPRFATRLNRLHYGLLLPLSARRAARVIVPSRVVADDLQRFAPGARGVLVPLGVEDFFFVEPSARELEQARARWNLPPRFVLFVGNPEPKKNMVSIIHAMRGWPVEMRGIPLVTAGGARAWKDFAPLHAGTTNVAANASGQSEVLVRSLGYVPRGDLPLLFRLCSAFAFPSLAEGFGLPVLEALACGAPVVASDRVPIEGIESVARLVDPLDVAALAHALAEALDESTAVRRESGERAQKWARRFSWHTAALKTAAVYREAAGG